MSAAGSCSPASAWSPARRATASTEGEQPVLDIDAFLALPQGKKDRLAEQGLITMEPVVKHAFAGRFEFIPFEHDQAEHGPRGVVPADQPLAAHVTYAWGDRMVNLMAITPNGTPFGVTSVPLVQDDEATPIERYAAWMPLP